MLRPDPPQLRTAEALIHKYEQIQDGLESGRVTGKLGEQMNQSLKGIQAIERLGLQYLSLVLKFGRKAPVPRTPILRDMLGLPTAIGPGDGEAVRALLPEK